MQTVHDDLGQIIDNLLLIKKNTDKISSIEKDILLQNLREAYLAILRCPVLDEKEVVENKKETIDEPQKENEVEELVEEKVEMREEEQLEGENEEMDVDILEFVKAVPKAVFEEKSLIQKIPDLFSEPEVKVETAPEPDPVVEAKPEPEVAPEPGPVPEPVKLIEPEPVKVVAPEPVVEVKPEPVVAPEPEPVPEPVKVVEPEPVKEELHEPIVETKPEPVAAPEPVVVAEPEPIIEPAPRVFTQPKVEVKPQQRSLNDLFNEQKKDLGEKFQQTKIADLTKAMSINDKFLFIRELFKNKSEEFSHAIHTLNKCENIEEAFDTMEGLKKQYFWDSISSAYLALCDLVRRKF